MGLRRSIDTDFWTDTWVETLTPGDKLAFVYLFSCPATNPAGLYKLSLRRMAFDTGLSEEQITDAIAKFQANKRILYDRQTSVVWVCHFREYHGSTSPKWCKGADDAVRKIPDSPPRRAYLEKWPIGTLPLPVPDDDGSDGGGPRPLAHAQDTVGIPYTEGMDRLTEDMDEVGTCQGQGQRQSQGQGHAEVDRSSFGRIDQYLKLPAEGKKALIRSCIRVWEEHENRSLTGTENVALLQFVAEHTAQVVFDACKVTKAYRPKNFGGYLRVVLKNATGGRSPPSKLSPEDEWLAEQEGGDGPDRPAWVGCAWAGRGLATPTAGRDTGSFPSSGDRRSTSTSNPHSRSKASSYSES